MADRPPLAQPGDEIARQLTGQPQQLTAGQDEQIQSLTEGLQSRRTAEANLVEFQQGEGAANLQAIQEQERVPFQDPSARLQAELALQESSRDLLSDAKAGRIDAMLALNNFLDDLGTGKQKSEIDDVKLALETVKLREKGYRLEDGDLIRLTDAEIGKQNLTGDDAIAEATQQGGEDFVNTGRSHLERIAIAENIMRMGGVAEYRKTQALDDLITSTERNDLEEQNALIILLNQGLGVFEDFRGPIGTGPILGRLIPGAVAGKRTRGLRRITENIRSTYQKIISGATVSDAEVKRLKEFLPTTTKTEETNIEDMQSLLVGLQINQKIFEIGKKENLTPNEAFSKYGEDVFEEFGQPFPGKESDEVEFDVQGAIDAGYSQDEIDQFLGGK
ncbi:MAG: hypothetical protein DRN81_03805 [Thermoproteota archaeon]|nr:MAG: hypothetical protein DRN81_03805 [Candidatus Korarchaeota archaeon]